MSETNEPGGVDKSRGPHGYTSPMGKRARPAWEQPAGDEYDSGPPVTAQEAELGLDTFYGRIMVWPDQDARIQHPGRLDPDRVHGFGDGELIERDPRWRALRQAWVREHPACVVCGSKRLLEVHHKKPFHLFPHLELERSNLMTLCQGSRGANCHFLVGHGCDWSRYVKEPELVAQTLRVEVFVKLQPETRLMLTDLLRQRLAAKAVRVDPGFNEGGSEA